VILGLIGIVYDIEGFLGWIKADIEWQT